MVRDYGGKTLIVVADGLGHGLRAFEAVDTLCSLIQAAPLMPLPDLLLWSHKQMRQTRGAAVAALLLDRAAKIVTYSGIGNIAFWHINARIGAISSKRMVSGILGYREIAPLQFSFPYLEGDRLLLHTDGVQGNLRAHLEIWHRPPERTALDVIELFSTGQDDALALVVRLGRSDPQVLEQVCTANQLNEKADSNKT
ncbi:stage II sporulation protein E [Tumebacillus sp. BK434]|uniref:SpoIIE family protein phosphatase n=1 Tax=Tumebacillus sp. BK434 TaxID=2512169 RepID=UPI00104D6611|nr:SpoIIE family protein phosphatase [Tumebacillus sp. BK434]TCP55573.1 stage II sporulation protein E [Tumebacillus sp. BK434]